MNEQFAHYATTVPGNGEYSAPIPLHFVHERSDDEAATPLLLIHGWASTHLEWSRIIKPLAQQGSKAFHVVAVDLPGFGFSPAARQPGLGAREMGRAFDALMRQLGYDKYGLVTTDLGWLIGMWMVEDVRDSIIGHFTDFFLVPTSESDFARQAQNETTEEENQFMAAAGEWFANHASYATMMNQKPAAISLAFTDSPVGFAGWLWDLKYGSSDGFAYEYNELITDTMLQWIQPPYPSIEIYSGMNRVSWS
jgi:pimeloyl-ACP methyl ester carboxylesterase